MFRATFLEYITFLSCQYLMKKQQNNNIQINIIFINYNSKIVYDTLFLLVIHKIIIFQI